jgi:protein TonB
MRGFGNPQADQWTCSLIMQRGQFRPATDAAGRPVSAWFGYRQADR